MRNIDDCESLDTNNNTNNNKHIKSIEGKKGINIIEKELVRETLFKAIKDLIIFLIKILKYILFF